MASSTESMDDSESPGEILGEGGFVATSGRQSVCGWAWVVKGGESWISRVREREWKGPIQPFPRTESEFIRKLIDCEDIKDIPCGERSGHDRLSFENISNKGTNWPPLVSIDVEVICVVGI
jgi:hypothetical protein